MESIKYKCLEKLLKKHLGNSKSIYIDVGRKRSTRRYKHSKDYGELRSLNEKGEPDMDFYGYDVSIQRTFDRQTDGKSHNHRIILMARFPRRHSDRVVFKEEITNLDRLFKLLAKKGDLLKTLIEKNLVVDRLSDDNDNNLGKSHFHKDLNSLFGGNFNKLLGESGGYFNKLLGESLKVMNKRKR